MPPLACKNFEIYDVRAFVSHKKPLKFSQGTPTEVAYEERAHGEFTNEIQNEKLHTIMEEIRQIINEKS
jgi:hypothetical protein